MSSIPRRNREPDSEMRILVEVVVWEVISGNLATEEQRLLGEKEDNKEWW